jgi:hypothetical protein
VLVLLLLLLLVVVAAPGCLMLLLLGRLWVVAVEVCPQGRRWHSGCSSCRLQVLLVLAMHRQLRATPQVGAL